MNPSSPGSSRPRPPAPPTRVWGVLGGIGSGKSAVARLLAGPGGRVLDADAIAHGVLASPEVSALVRERFGADVLGPDGSPDRKRLAEVIFSDPGARAVLEGWTHPRVRATILARLEEARASGVARVVLDVPLLLENDAEHGFAALCDALIFVEAPEAERERRVRSTRGWGEGELARRQAAQLPLSEKRDRADFILRNDGSEEDLERAVGALLQELGAHDTHDSHGEQEA